MKDTVRITMEYEGEHFEADLEMDFFRRMFDISLGEEDFVTKVTHGITDLTSDLANEADRKMLKELYRKLKK